MTAIRTAPLVVLLAACGGPDADSADTTPACVAPSGEPEFGTYGGDTRVSLEATGFFRTEKLCDRWWLVTPDGHPFYSLGVNTTGPDGDAGIESGERVYQQTVEEIYDSEEDWADAVVARFEDWSWNTAGCWSDRELFLPRLPLTVSLGLAPYDWYTGEQGDLFDPAWEEQVAETVAEKAAPYADESRIVGWFLDNEVSWGPDWHDLGTLLEKYLEKSADAPGKVEAVDLVIEELGGTVDEVNEALGTAFADRDEMLETTEGWRDWLSGDEEPVPSLITAFQVHAAEQYFSVTTEALRSADPNHLVLGNRAISVMTPLEIFEVAAGWLDLFSINNYVFAEGIAEGVIALTGSLDPADGFAALHAEIDLPILITEFGFRADGSGPPNTYPPIYPTYEDQEQRADAFEDYAREHQAVPWIVGYHWFEWVDQPEEGRSGDGEDNNWGLVNEQDEPYVEVTERSGEVNEEVWGYLEVEG